MEQQAVLVEEALSTAFEILETNQEIISRPEPEPAVIPPELDEGGAIRSLNNTQLVESLLFAQAAERRITLRVLLHLIEVERRGLHLRAGYGSMFDYCTSKLGYSASAAVRRIRTARCIRDYPVVYWKLKSGELNLSTVSQAAGIMNADNASQVIAQISSASQRKVAGVVAQYKPESVLPERVRPVCLKKDGGEVERRVKLEFSVTPESYEKLEMVQVLLSNKYSGGVSLEQAFAEILEEYYDRHAPERKHARRLARLYGPEAEKAHEKSRGRSGGKEVSTEESKQEPEEDTGAQEQTSSTRYIPSEVKEAVFLRDGGRCTYVGPDGRRCNSTWNLQYDHVQGFARGAGNGVDDLRLLCSAKALPKSLTIG